MATIVACPQCRGAKEVHLSLYSRDKVHRSHLHREDAWRKDQLNADGTCIVRSEAVTCRVCWGQGNL